MNASASSSSKDNPADKGKSTNKQSSSKVAQGSSSKASVPTVANAKAKVVAGPSKPSGTNSSSAASVCAAILNPPPKGILVERDMNKENKAPKVALTAKPALIPQPSNQVNQSELKELVQVVKDQNDNVRGVMGMMEAFVKRMEQPVFSQQFGGLPQPREQIDTDENLSQLEGPTDDDWEQSSHHDDEDIAMEEEEDNDVGGSVMDRFGPPKSQFVPSQLNIQLWETVTKLSSAFNDEDWRKFSTNALVKRWSGSAQAVAFSAPKPDPGLVDLHFQDQKDMEKQLISAQKAAGAIGAVSTKMLESIEGLF